MSDRVHRRIINDRICRTLFYYGNGLAIRIVALSIVSVACVTAWSIAKQDTTTTPTSKECSNASHLQHHLSKRTFSTVQAHRSPGGISLLKFILYSPTKLRTTTSCTPSGSTPMETQCAATNTTSNIEASLHQQQEYVTLVYPDNRTDSTQQYELMPIPDRGKLSTHAIHGTLYKESCIERYDVYRRKTSKISSLSLGMNSTNGEKKSTITTTSNEVIMATTSETSRSPPDIIAIVKIGSNLDGHSSIVHGGILALMVDDALGFGYYSILLREHENRRMFDKNNIFLDDDRNGNKEKDDDYFDPKVVAVTANLNMNYRAPLRSNSTMIIEAFLVSDSSPNEGRHDKSKFHWEVVVRSYDGSTTYCQATSLYVIPKKRLIVN